MLSSVNLGFLPDHVLALQLVRIDRPRPDTTATKSTVPSWRSLPPRRSRVGANPGVLDASLSWLGLFGTSDQSVQTYDPASPDQTNLTRIDYVSGRYFETAGMAAPSWTDVPPIRPRRCCATWRSSTSRSQLPGIAERRTVGRRVGVSGGGIDAVFEIIGVVGDSKYNNLRETQSKPMIWLSLAQTPQPAHSVMLRVQPGAESCCSEASASSRAICRSESARSWIDNFEGSRQPNDIARAHRARFWRAPWLRWLSCWLPLGFMDR